MRKISGDKDIIGEMNTVFKEKVKPKKLLAKKYPGNLRDYEK